MVIAYVLLALLAIWVYSDAKARGDAQPVLWALGTLLLALIVLPIWLIKRPPKGGPTRPCPHCAEPIQRAASVCRYCGRDVPVVTGAVSDLAGAAPRSVGARLRHGLLVVSLIVAGVAVVAWVAMFLPSPGSSSSPSAGFSSGFSSSGVTMANYNRLETGMSYAQAVAILGEPGMEQSRSDIAGYTTVMYTWHATGIANMNAMFQNDRLVSKAQLGLK